MELGRADGGDFGVWSAARVVAGGFCIVTFPTTLEVSGSCVFEASGVSDGFDDSLDAIATEGEGSGFRDPWVSLAWAEFNLEAWYVLSWGICLVSGAALAGRKSGEGFIGGCGW